MGFNNDNDLACTETSANEINADSTEEDSSLLDINCTETSASDISADSTEGGSSLLNFNLLKKVIDSSILEVIKNDGVYLPDGSWNPNVKPFGDLSKPPVSKSHAKTLGSTQHEIGYYQGLAHINSGFKKMSILESDPNDKYLFSEKNHNRSRTLMLNYYNSHPKPPKGLSLSAITAIASIMYSRLHTRKFCFGKLSAMTQDELLIAQEQALFTSGMLYTWPWTACNLQMKSNDLNQQAAPFHTSLIPAHYNAHIHEQLSEARTLSL